MDKAIEQDEAAEPPRADGRGGSRDQDRLYFEDDLGFLDDRALYQNIGPGSFRTKPKYDPAN